MGLSIRCKVFLNRKPYANYKDIKEHYSVPFICLVNPNVFVVFIYTTYHITKHSCFYHFTVYLGKINFLQFHNCFTVTLCRTVQHSDHQSIQT